MIFHVLTSVTCQPIEETSSFAFMSNKKHYSVQKKANELIIFKLKMYNFDQTRLWGSYFTLFCSHDNAGYLVKIDLVLGLHQSDALNFNEQASAFYPFQLV